MSRLTGAQMKYLHIIYKAGKGGGSVRAVDVARELGVTKASTSRMMKLFADMGLIAVAERGSIGLTPKGKNEGGLIHRRVTAIRPFFADYLGLSEPESADSAYFFVSGFSERCIDSLLSKRAQWDGDMSQNRSC